MNTQLKTQLLGTFQLNGSLEIHSWYNYLAGYSAYFVKKILEEENITPEKYVLDPFCGVGTTNIVCKKFGIPSVGIEVNPFTAFVAETKLFWDFSKDELLTNFNNFVEYLKISKSNKIAEKNKNKVLSNAFSPKVLTKLLFLKEKINDFEFVGKTEKLRNLYKLALITILRDVSNYESFSPYLKKRSSPLEDAPVIKFFLFKIQKMINDLIQIKNKETLSKIYNKDARDLSFLKNKFDLVITSPPYLNNWDYSWITRIELFFLDYVSSNKDLNNGLRRKLIKSSTYLLNKKESALIIPESEIKNEIMSVVDKLRKKRIKQKNGKKYDLMVVEYFNDIYKILTELFRIMNPRSKNIWVVGDSGLYGEHIKTDIWIGKLSELVGFKFIKYDVLRKRKASRHNIKLRESVIYMER